MQMDPKKEILIAVPHGMCAGVRRALEAVESVLHRCGTPVYVLHEIVHNDFIVNDLRRRGVRFAETLAEVPEGCCSSVPTEFPPRWNGRRKSGNSGSLMRPVRW